jgi:hypothetical protein
VLFHKYPSFCSSVLWNTAFSGFMPWWRRNSKSRPSTWVGAIRLGYRKHHRSAAARTQISNKINPKYPLVIESLTDFDATR